MQESMPSQLVAGALMMACMAFSGNRWRGGPPAGIYRINRRVSRGSASARLTKTRSKHLQLYQSKASARVSVAAKEKTAWTCAHAARTPLQETIF
jgi:hypothetical protein